MALEEILLAVGSDNQDRLGEMVNETLNFAGPADATVTVLFFFSQEEYDEKVPELNADVTRGELTPDEVAERQNSVRTISSQFEEADVDYDVQGLAGGTMSEQVIKRIDDMDIDVAVISGSRRSPAGKAMFGDHAQQVLLEASCPVLYLNGK